MNGNGEVDNFIHRNSFSFSFFNYRNIWNLM